ncbi:Bax inhibitor-1/YccA family membrane protein [Parafilimonas sp.]|uniref:Bax inhibitor-1/YccA family protein n=1 Tax=Parafilimonas sp. TaxID=1969739 RepID=UPI0039E37EDC
MALFQSDNPTLSQKIFSRSIAQDEAGTMTVRGSVGKFGFLLFMVLAAASYTWYLYYNNQPQTMMTLMWVGIIGGLISVLAICFKPTLAPYLSPAYGILEGFFLGAISAVLNDAFSEKYPGLVMQAVGLTFGVALAMFLLYNFRVIKATERFKSTIFAATAGIAIFYLITLVLRLFHVNIPFMYDSSLLGIGLSLFIVAIAALNLIIDFDMIEKGADMGAPKYMEWYGAFGLLVTMVWLYVEILKLLSRFAGRK